MCQFVLFHRYIEIERGMLKIFESWEKKSLDTQNDTGITINNTLIWFRV